MEFTKFKIFPVRTGSNLMIFIKSFGEAVTSLERSRIFITEGESAGRLETLSAMLIFLDDPSKVESIGRRSTILAFEVEAQAPTGKLKSRKSNCCLKASAMLEASKFQKNHVYPHD